MGLFDLFTGDAAKSAADAAANDARQGYQNGYNQYADLAGQGRNALTSNYTSGISGFQPFYNTGTQANTALANGLGLNGQAGYDSAVKNFQAGPGFQFALNQGLNAVDRRAASRGMLGSGNTNIDTINYATGLGNQSWQQYLQNLGGLNSQGLQSAAGQGSLYAGLGSGLNNSFTGQGTQAYNAQTGIGNANAGADIAKGNADMAASGNLWGALFKGANLLSGGLGSGLFSGFGGGAGGGAGGDNA